MYYSPWCIADAACIACGLSYSGTEIENGEKVEKYETIMCI